MTTVPNRLRQELPARTDHQRPTAPRNSIAAQVAHRPDAVNKSAGSPANPAVRTARATHGHERVRVTRQAITRHLEVLSDAGLVHGTRRGRERLWELDRSRLELARRCIDHISEWWDEQLAGLKASVEEAGDPP